MRQSGCDRVLALLADGRDHSHHEIYALHVIGHSRIADLRRRGYRIDQRRDGDLYLYRLVGALDETVEEQPALPAAVSSSALGAAVPAAVGTDGTAAPSAPGQLTIDEAA